VGRDFPPVQTVPGAHSASCTMSTGSFPGVKYGRCVLLTTHPLLVPRSWKSRAITLPTLWVKPRPVTRIFHFYFYYFLRNKVTALITSRKIITIHNSLQSAQ